MRTSCLKSKSLFIIVKIASINSENKSELQMGFQSTTLGDLVISFNHRATGEQDQQKIWIFGWNRTPRSHSQEMTCSVSVYNCIALPAVETHSIFRSPFCNAKETRKMFSIS